MKSKFIAISILITQLFVAGITFAASNSTSPASDFFDKSWQKMDDTKTFSNSCAITISQFKKKANLSADQNKNADLLGKAIRAYKERTLQVYVDKNKSLMANAEKTNSVYPVYQLDKGNMSYDDAKAKITASNRILMNFATIADKLYYKAENQGEKIGWKAFVDAINVPKLFTEIGKSLITTHFNKSSFKFISWKNSGTAKNAIYSGLRSSDDTNSIVQNITGKTIADLGPAKVQLYIDEKTGDWKKAETVLKVEDTLASFQVKEVCNLAFGNKVKMQTPKNAETIDANAGMLEFSLLGMWYSNQTDIQN